ncbi:DUF881 domain-containing protein [Cellulomonas soli]|uniref:Membrane protein n=1 Tax=Cellulomonas soli TaxID=931535 RepID=A0A512PAQ6_9CELL|nr:DUF881 domain-containing protein [Cellulomonas soli]NYI60667.1 uncharacterized protein YlxW (UPF0749 family) [Cellulomonas soli]GEP68182.1 membrane protein [Cellulomonas soli]
MTARHGTPAGAPAGPARRPDASMTLLIEVQERPLDPGYQLVADRRRAGEAPPRRWAGSAVLTVLALLLGLGVTAATVALRRPAADVAATRQLLEEQITARTDEATALGQQVTGLSSEISALQTQALASEDPELLAALNRDAVAAGTVAVTGAGLRIVLTDAPTADPDTQDPDERVQDFDLQVLANALWASGAEAVAINGERLTATSAIRSAGDAVYVDLVPLVSPYTVEAIGDPVGLQTGLAQSSAGSHLASLRSMYRIGVQLQSVQDLELPGTGQVTLRYATVPPDTDLGVLGDTSPTVSPSPGDTPTPAGETGTDDTADAVHARGHL